MRKLLCAVAVAAILAVAGCTALEKSAYNTIVASNAFLKKAKAQHPECTTGATAQVCTLLSQATSAKDALIDATEVYCASPSFDQGGACTPPAKGSPASQQAIAKLQAAIAAYNQTAKDLQGAL
jgi:hypothetical protein